MKTVTEKQAEKSTEPSNDSKIISQLTEVLSVLSKDDALTIFRMAGEGIKSEIDTPARIGLTKKQYYTRLKQLVDLGLITKHNESYTQTAFGRVVYQKHIMGLVNNIKNSKYLQMVDVLKADPKFNEKDIMEFMSKVEPQVSSDMQDSAQNGATIVSSYEDMVRRILEMIEFAQKDILLVTRFQNEMIINSILKKSSAGVNVKALADIGMVEEYFAKEREIKSDKNRKERESVVSNPFYPSKIDRRYAQVPFCIVIVDSRHVGIEIADVTDSRKFKMAVFAEDQAMASSMTDLFANLWQTSVANPPQRVTKTA